MYKDNNNITNTMKLKALKFMLLGKEFKFEISYSERYLKKIKQLFAKSTPEVK
jgi:hypothetical protein